VYVTVALFLPSISCVFAPHPLGSLHCHHSPRLFFLSTSLAGPGRSRSRTEVYPRWPDAVTCRGSIGCISPGCRADAAHASCTRPIPPGGPFEEKNIASLGSGTHALPCAFAGSVIWCGNASRCTNASVASLSLAALAPAPRAFVGRRTSGEPHRAHRCR